MAFAQPASPPPSDSEAEFDDADVPMEGPTPRVSPQAATARGKLDGHLERIDQLLQNHQFDEAAAEIKATMAIAWENEFHDDHAQLVEHLAQIPALQAAHAAQEAARLAKLEADRMAKLFRLHKMVQVAREESRNGNYANAIRLLKQAIAFAEAAGHVALAAALNQNLTDAQAAQQAEEAATQHLQAAATATVIGAGLFIFGSALGGK